jgi:hypothetical protein
MKKYLIVTGILSFLLVSLIYSYFFIPGIKEKFNFNITKISETEETGPEYKPEINLSDTFPDTSINKSEYKEIIFNKLRIPLEQNFQIESTENQINIKKNANESVQGAFYPLNAVKKSEGISTEGDYLSNYNYSFKTPNNLPKDLLKEIENKYSPQYQIIDNSFNSPTNLTLVEIIASKDSDMTSFFFKSDSRERVRVVVLTKENLYIFAVKTSPENINKIEKTFYNISLVK